MRLALLIFLCVMPVHVAHADIASIEYVNKSSNNKVDISESANQTMAGTYTISGTLVVPTPPLPNTQ